MARKMIRVSGESLTLVEKWNTSRNQKRKARNQQELTVGEEADAFIATAASRLGSLAKDAEKNRQKKGAPKKASKKAYKKSPKKSPKKASKKVTTKKATKPRTAKKGGSKLSALANKRSNGASARA